MLRSTVWSKQITRNTFSLSSLFPILGTVIALLLGWVIGMFIPPIMNIVSVEAPARIGRIFETPGLGFWGLVAAVIIIAIVLILRQDELAAVAVVAVHLYIDWYFGLALTAIVITLALLLVFFLARSSQYPWVEPRALWLWGLFLVLAIPPAIRGSLTLRDTVIYYPNIVFGAFLMFWLGTVIGRNIASIRLVFSMLAFFAALIAVHTIIQATMGITLFGSSQAEAYLTSVSNYRLAPGIDVNRLGSFFIDPNWDGAFLAMMLFIPLGLFVESNTFLKKALWLAEVLIILPALLFTYSAGAWVSVCGGMIVFIALVGRFRFRVQLILLISVALTLMIAWFPEQLALQIQHAQGPDELSLRLGAWQTGLNLTLAYPLTGVGLGQLAYLEYSLLYQAPLQGVRLDHPHNSYLEWGAMAGLPVLFVFLALLSFALWQALRNWVRADVRARCLLGAGIAAIASLTINSLSINGWTLYPIAATGWLILGVISSPLLAKNRNGAVEQENNTGLHA